MTCILVEDYWGTREEYRINISDPVRTLKQMIEETAGKRISVFSFFM